MLTPAYLIDWWYGCKYLRTTARGYFVVLYCTIFPPKVRLQLSNLHERSVRRIYYKPMSTNKWHRLTSLLPSCHNSRHTTTISLDSITEINACGASNNTELRSSACAWTCIWSKYNDLFLKLFSSGPIDIA